MRAHGRDQLFQPGGICARLHASLLRVDDVAGYSSRDRSTYGGGSPSLTTLACTPGRSWDLTTQRCGFMLVCGRGRGGADEQRSATGAVPSGVVAQGLLRDGQRGREPVRGAHFDGGNHLSSTGVSCPAVAHRWGAYLTGPAPRRPYSCLPPERIHNLLYNQWC